MSDLDNSEMTILVADDQEPNRELLFALLTAEGYRVLCAEDGELALRTIKDIPIDLAILDVVMPKQTGFAVCQLTKSAPETCLIPIVLVTGLNSSDDRGNGAMGGADDFLTKPVNKYELLARVRSLLKLKQFTDDLDNADTVLSSLALSIEAKDPYTEGHGDRLSECFVALAEKLGSAQG